MKSFNQCINDFEQPGSQVGHKKRQTSFWFYFSVLVIPTCGRLSWPALWSTFGRTIK